MHPKTNQFYEFGPFRFHPEEHALTRNAEPVSLPPRVTETLSLLLQNAGHLVEKETLIKEVWKDAIVEEGNLNKNIFVLRKALGQWDGGREYIETVPKRGYRWVGPVQKQTMEAISASTPKTDVAKSKGDFHFRIVGGALSLILLGILAAWWFSRRFNESALPQLDVVPLVAMAGSQIGPVFSPDGNEVAFKQLDKDESGIYVSLVGGEKPLRLTESPGDCCPAWSPDGRQIAFLRWSKEGWSIYLIPALGGTAHRLYSANIGPHLDWSPDGRFLLFSENNTEKIHFRIMLLSLSDLTARALTSPPELEEDDAPAFSPDGLSVAFVRGGIGGPGRNLFVVRVSGGEPKQLTANNNATGPAWTQDGREIVFSSQRGGRPDILWRIFTSGGKPTPLQGIGAMAFNPSISRKGNQLAYQHAVITSSIVRIKLTDAKHAVAPAAPLISSTGANLRPSYAPDGMKIAFESDRLGYSDIWYCHSDGSNCAQLTALHGTAGTARWSPDGHHIAFEAQTEHTYQVYVVEAPGGQPQLVATFPKSDNGAPNWSRDGHWIYFYSTHQNGSFQLWKVPFAGGSPVEVTQNGGVYAIESDDGKFLYYAKLEQPGIWKMPLNGGPETRVLEKPINWFNWALAHTGIYFLDESAGQNGEIEFFDFETRHTTAIQRLEKPVLGPAGLTISPDGSSLLYGRDDFFQSYVMLARNFR
jgi:Tol biopolymer transport system component/DNA-binding winged helix-turn-helix (wHTH) protein